MASIIPGFEYDIFISYRQKDNKGDRWVSEVVESLKTELESTFKEEISGYFDINPHDGLLETHDVDASLKEKLKCLIFIPIISRTYCDPKSFAWEHEFKAFIEQASNDKYGLKVKLSGANVASRVIPVQIYDLNPEDRKIVESELGGYLRGIEFIYKEPGVNRPLTLTDDEKRNLNNTKYKNQINKVANAINEIIDGLKYHDNTDKVISERIFEETPSTRRTLNTKIITGSLLLLILIVSGYFIIQKLIKTKEQADKSIAVLPFKLLSDEPDKQYLADGMMDAITLHLSKIRDLRVMSRTSVEQYRETRKTTRQIGKELDVEYLLEGSFQKVGENAKLIVQLIKANEESHAWGNEYNSKWSDVFSLQSEVAQTIARELGAAITPEEKQKIEIIPTTSLTAYDFYQRSYDELIDFIQKGSLQSLQRTEELAHKALEYDSAFAKAYVILANVYCWRSWIFSDKFLSENYLDSALILSDKALSFDKQLPEAYFSRAIYYNNAGNPRQAIIEFDKAIKYNPNFSAAYEWLGMVVYLTSIYYSDYVKGLECLHKAARLTHGSELPGILYTLANGYTLCAGFPEEGKKYFEEALRLTGDTTTYLANIGALEIQYGDFNKGIEKRLRAYSGDSAKSGLGEYYFFHGDYKESLKYWVKTIERSKSSGQNLFGYSHLFGYLFWQNGFKKEAEFWFNKQVEISEEAIKLGRYYASSFLERSNAYYDLAGIYAFRGEKEKALEMLRMFDRCPVMPLSMVDDIKKYNPLFNSIRYDPEFQKIVRSWEIKYQAEHERVGKWIEKHGKLN